MNGHRDFRQYGPPAKWLFLRRSPVREHGVLCSSVDEIGGIVKRDVRDLLTYSLFGSTLLM
jgi:hypothetical protein